MAGAVNRRILLRNRPKGMIDDSVFEMVSEEVPEVGPGQALVRTLYISVDPANRGWLADVESYLPPVGIGEVMRALGVGQVVASENDALPVGQLISGLVGWQEYLLVGGETSSFSPTLLPPEAIFALPMTVSLGMTGLTAYVGMEDIGKPQPGETVVVSAAAGATGSVAGQIAKIHGARVVGIVGSEEKRRWLLDELGFDAAINRREPDWREQLARACPDGVDVDFENVGGEIMQAVFSMLNLHARVIVCGLISGYNDERDPTGALSAPGGSMDLVSVLIKRLHVEGFIVVDHMHRFPEATAQFLAWLQEGKLKLRETVIEGLERAPEALGMLFEGRNIGKLMVKVADPNGI